MDWQPQQPDTQPDPLDRLLAGARWAEPAPEAVGRLRSQWRSLMRRRSRRRRLFALATAGSLLAAGLAIWQFLSAALRPTQENNIAAPSSPLQAQTPAAPKANPLLAVVHPPVKKPAAVRGSGKAPSNPYEQMLVTVHKRAARQRRGNQSLAKPEPKDTVAQAEKPAARRAEPSIRDMLETTDSPTLGRLAGRQQEPAVRKEVLAALFARDDPTSVNAFLALVDDQKTAADALACAADAPNPPLQSLFQCLSSPQSGRRMAAAQVLGQLNQPAVSRELIAMARGAYRQYAMIALLSSSEPAARQFVANAGRDPMLSATVLNAGRLLNAKRVPKTTSSWRS
jgi:hypothetical protein